MHCLQFSTTNSGCHEQCLESTTKRKIQSRQLVHVFQGCWKFATSPKSKPCYIVVGYPFKCFGSEDFMCKMGTPNTDKDM